MVNLRVGSLVKAHAGRDKNRWFVAVAVNGGFVEIADGKERKLEKPKRKNIKHISPADTAIDVNGLTNKKLRKLINEFETRNLYQADRRPLDGEVF